MPATKQDSHHEFRLFRDARERSDLSTGEVAERLGMEAREYEAFEADPTGIGLADAVYLCIVLGIEPEELAREGERYFKAKGLID